MTSSSSSKLSPSPSPSPSPTPFHIVDRVMEDEEATFPEFTLSEILKIEGLYRVKGDESLNQKLCQDLATKFSTSVHRIGKPDIEWEQVLNWFLEKQKNVETKITYAAVNIKESDIAADATSSKNSIKSSSAVSLKNIVLNSNIQGANSATEILQKPKAQRVAELEELVFEALSSKDSAWFDVAAFLNTCRDMPTSILRIQK